MSQNDSHRKGSLSRWRKSEVEQEKLHPKNNSSSEEDKRKQRQLRFSKPSKPKNSEYGFVSRGEDSRLQVSEDARREYFDWILDTFSEFCEQNEGSPLGSLPREGTELKEKKVKGKAEKSEKSEKETEKSESIDSANTISTAGVDKILTSLRKLREALLYKQPDEFSKKVFLFSVRVSSSVGHYQTYVPTINHLLSHASLLSPSEHRELATLLVLHVSHCNKQNAKALELFFEHLDTVKDARILATLRSFITGDYYTWLDIYNSETGHSIFAIMTFGLLHMMSHMVKCVSALYFSVSEAEIRAKFLPRGIDIETFQKRYSSGWRVDEGMVVVRERRR